MYHLYITIPGLFNFVSFLHIFQITNPKTKFQILSTWKMLIYHLPHKNVYYGLVTFLSEENEMYIKLKCYLYLCIYYIFNDGLYFKLSLMC